MPQEKYINREISWIFFNERVLQEAEDKNNSVFERLKFLAIFSSNLDEFYRVRVSKLRQFRRLKKDSEIRLKEKPKRVIKQIQKEVNILQDRFGEVYRNQILKELEEKGIVLIEASDFNNNQKEFSKQLFNSTIKSHVKVIKLEGVSNLEFLKDKDLFFYINEDEPLLVSIPVEECGRFIKLPQEGKIHYVSYLEEILRDNFKSILPNTNIDSIYSVKITRDGHLYYEEEDGEMIALIKESLKERDLGQPSRILYDSRMPKKLLKSLRKELSLKKTDLMPGGKFHNFSDFFQFPFSEDKDEITKVKEAQLDHHILSNVDSVMEHIYANDELLCYPYQNYNTVERLLNEAAINDTVEHIFITLYRISSDSLVAKGLLKCLEKGKKVTVFVEAKARFDEENNIEWGEKLEDLGANVLYSMADIKVHSKIMLIKTSEKDVAYIGTGNFNEASAKIYADFALLTSNKVICADLSEVFSFLMDTSYKPQVNSIWMSPFTTRKELNTRIDNEIDIVKNGGKGLLFFKMNSLEDKSIIDKLYEASNAGVEIKLLVRGLCCLVPGIEGLSENIKIISIVGKYLEHARVYVFGNNGANDLFIGSADCMGRNLDKRVEVIVPIKDKVLKSTIETCIDLQWKDNVKGRIIDAEQANIYQKTGGKPVNSQEDFKEYLRAKH